MANKGIDVTCLKVDCRWNKEGKCATPNILVGNAIECMTYEQDPEKAMAAGLGMMTPGMGGMAPSPAPLGGPVAPVGPGPSSAPSSPSDGGALAALLAAGGGGGRV